jgi:hypothetical protein
VGQLAHVQKNDGDTDGSGWPVDGGAPKGHGLDDGGDDPALHTPGIGTDSGSNGWDDDGPEEDQLGRLHEAAPDLLAACKAFCFLLAWESEEFLEDSIYSGAYSMAVDAITKATGVAPESGRCAFEDTTRDANISDASGPQGGAKP